MLRTTIAASILLAALCPYALSQQTFYFVETLDTVPEDPGSSLLATVEIDGSCGPSQARVAPLPVGPAGDGIVPYDNVVALSVPADGLSLVLLDTAQPVSRLVTVDLASGQLSPPRDVLADVGPVDGLGTIQQAAHAPDGQLYVTSSGQDRLYTLDVETAFATSIGQPIWDVDGRTVVDIQGADIAFGSDGNLFLFTNLSLTPTSPAPRGLYRLTLPTDGSQVVSARWLGADHLLNVSGMFMLDGGLGDVVVAESATDDLVVLDRQTGSEVARYALTDAACSRYTHVFGDMNNGPLAPAECFLLIGDGPGTALHAEVAHLFETQVGPAVQASHPLLLDLLPEFVLPQPGASLGQQGQGTAGQGPVNAQSSPRWMQDGEFAVQVVMWNPVAFPSQPEQFSAGLHVRIQPDGGVVTTPYGHAQGGLEIGVELDTNAAGQPVIRFPFSIQGL